MSESVTELRSRIEQRSAKIGVIGLGYVGLPAACLFADAGFDVRGVDLDTKRTATINSGRTPIEGEEPGLAELVARVVAAHKMRAGTDYSQLAGADVVLVCVDTPVEPTDHRPRFKSLRSALSQLGAVMRKPALVIVESTLAPTTMDTVVRPTLEKATGGTSGVDFHLGHCPERVTPGKLLLNMRMMGRVCGAESQDVAELMVTLYRAFVQGDLDTTDCLTAELVKTAENAYRDVGIAFANEVALISERVGGDVWKVRQLVNKVPGRVMLLPGGGVGGHCIPKDSWLLAAPLGDEAEGSLLGSARRINDGMPAHVADLVTELLHETSKPYVAVLGYAYREDSDDARNSPTAEVVAALADGGIEYAIHDPFVDPYRRDVMEVLRRADCAVLMVAHSAYRGLDLEAAAKVMNHRAMVDARGFFGPSALHAAGFRYRVIGVGQESGTTPPSAFPLPTTSKGTAN